jgi:hypothetical protein
MRNNIKSNSNVNNGDSRQCCMIVGFIYAPLAVLVGMATVISF